MSDSAQPSAIAIVLARGGSKGLPRKNALPIAGKPMLAWTIEHAKQSQRIGQVVVSTDDQELAEIAENFGAQVILRPADLAHDTATVDSAARHALSQLQNSPTNPSTPIAILYGNVPVRPHDLTDRAIDILLDTTCDSVQSVYQVGKTHPFWMKTVKANQDGGQLGMYVENNIFRRQDLPPVYMLDGGVIAVTQTCLMGVEQLTLQEKQDQPHAFLGQDRRAVITKEGSVIDIDNITDMRVAEAILLNQTQQIQQQQQ